MAGTMIGQTAWAQAQTSWGELYFTDEELPNAAAWLPAPPDTLGPHFAYDIMKYMWGKTVRDSQRGTVAHDDASSSMTYIARRFEPALGFLFSADTTPNLLRLLSKSYTTTNNANKKAKDYYKRKRPYVEFSEPTGVPEGERGSRNSASYPSGHATRGWTMALVLAELFPEKAEEILKVGYEYGESRVIVGYHYQSDVDAARIAAAAALAVVHANPEFQNDMELARQELKKLGYLK